MGAINDGSFTQPITYLGIAVGVGIAATSYFVGKRIRKDRAH